MYLPSPFGAVYVIPSVAPTNTPEGVEDESERLSQTFTYPSSAPETRILVDDSSAKHTALTVSQHEARLLLLTIILMS